MVFERSVNGERIRWPFTGSGTLGIQYLFREKISDYQYSIAIKILDPILPNILFIRKLLGSYVRLKMTNVK